MRFGKNIVICDVIDRTKAGNDNYYKLSKFTLRKKSQQSVKLFCTRGKRRLTRSVVEVLELNTTSCLKISS